MLLPSVAEHVLAFLLLLASSFVVTLQISRFANVSLILHMIPAHCFVGLDCHGDCDI